MLDPSPRATEPATPMPADRARRLVWTTAGLAFALRLPGVPLAIRPDEAGFVLVARSWEPTADSLYGHYFVDRPPLVVAVFGLADQLGSPTAVRLLGAVAAAATVLVAARIAALVADQRAAVASALLVAALVTTPLIDSVSVKGELLALPLMALTAYAALLAVRGDARRPVVLATLAGCAGALTLGLKQNLAGGLVFAAVLVVTSWLTGDVGRRDAARLLAGLAAGFAVPVAATLGWAVAAGVRPGVLWYAVYGFRGDAGAVLSAAGCCEGAAYERLTVLLLAATQAGILVALVAFFAHLRGEWRANRPATAATAGMLLVELVGLAVGGSYWRDYLFPLVPGLGIATALLVGRGGSWRAARWVPAIAVGSTVLAMVAWAGLGLAGTFRNPERQTGLAIRDVAEPGDTLVVHGGRADIQFASGLASPYRHLWSLPMRTLDPRYGDLRRLLSGPDAPTWLVEWVRFETWPGGRRLADVVDEHYVSHGQGCDGREVYLLRGVERPALAPDCD